MLLSGRCDKISLTSLERRFGVMRVRLRVSQEDPIEDDAFSLLRDSSSPLLFLSSPLLVSQFLVGSHRASEEVYRARASVEERQRTSGSACVRGDDDVVAVVVVRERERFHREPRGEGVQRGEEHVRRSGPPGARGRWRVRRRWCSSGHRVVGGFLLVVVVETFGVKKGGRFLL